MKTKLKRTFLLTILLALAGTIIWQTRYAVSATPAGRAYAFTESSNIPTQYSLSYSVYYSAENVFYALNRPNNQMELTRITPQGDVETVWTAPNPDWSSEAIALDPLTNQLIFAISDLSSGGNVYFYTYDLEQAQVIHEFAIPKNNDYWYDIHPLANDYIIVTSRFTTVIYDQLSGEEMQTLAPTTDVKYIVRDDGQSVLIVESNSGSPITTVIHTHDSITGTLVHRSSITTNVPIPASTTHPPIYTSEQLVVTSRESIARFQTDLFTLSDSIEFENEAVGLLSDGRIVALLELTPYEHAIRIFSLDSFSEYEEHAFAYTSSFPTYLTPTADEGIIIHESDRLITGFPIRYQSHAPVAMNQYCGRYYFDDFSDASTSWPIGGNDIVSFGYLNNRYQVNIFSNNVILNLPTPFTWDGSTGLQLDGKLENGNGVWGVGWGATYETREAFVFSPGGTSYFHLIFSPSTGWVVDSSGSTGSINPNAFADNTLRMVGYGQNSVAFQINDVTSFTRQLDPSTIRLTTLSLMPNTSFSIDNFYFSDKNCPELPSRASKDVMDELVKPDTIEQITQER